MGIIGQKRNKGRTGLLRLPSSPARLPSCFVSHGSARFLKPGLPQKGLFLEGRCFYFSPCASRFSGGRGYLSDRRPPLTVILPSADGDGVGNERAGWLHLPEASDVPALCHQSAEIRGWDLWRTCKKVPIFKMWLARTLLIRQHAASYAALGFARVLLCIFTLWMSHKSRIRSLPV